jgi:hypothetical protein
MYYLYQLSPHQQHIPIQMTSMNAPQPVSVSPKSVSPIVEPNSKSTSLTPTCSVSSIVSPTTTTNSQTRPQIVELVPLHTIGMIIVAALWMLLVQMVVSNTLIATSIFIFIKNAITCFGIIFILAMIVAPVAYAIHPKTVIDFKFASFAPHIADGLRKLDYFVNRFISATSKKLESGK